jgi:ATP-dependent helicase HepA
VGKPKPGFDQSGQSADQAGLLRKLDLKKVLVISRTIEKAEALDAAPRRHVTVKTGIFHEGLTLVQRDRNTAWFAEPVA